MKRALVMVLLLVVLAAAAAAQIPDGDVGSGFVTPGGKTYFFAGADGARAYVQEQIRLAQEQLAEYMAVFGMESELVERKSEETAWWESVELLEGDALADAVHMAMAGT